MFEEDFVDEVTTLPKKDVPVNPVKNTGNSFSDGQTVAQSNGIVVQDTTYDGSVGNINPSEWFGGFDDEFVDIPEPTPVVVVETPAVLHMDTPVVPFNKQGQRLGVAIEKLYKAGTAVNTQNIFDEVTKSTTNESLVSLVNQAVIDNANIYQDTGFDTYVRQHKPTFRRFTRKGAVVPDMQVLVKTTFSKRDRLTKEELESKTKEFNANINTFQYFYPDLFKKALVRKPIIEQAEYETVNGPETQTIMERLGDAQHWLDIDGSITSLEDVRAINMSRASDVMKERVFSIKAHDYLRATLLRAKNDYKTLGEHNIPAVAETSMNFRVSDQMMSDIMRAIREENASYVDVLKNEDLSVVLREYRPFEYPWLPTVAELVYVHGLDISKGSEDVIEITYTPKVQYNLMRNEHIVRTLSTDNAKAYSSVEVTGVRANESDKQHKNTVAKFRFNGSPVDVKVQYGRIKPQAMGSRDFVTGLLTRQSLNATILETVSPSAFNPSYAHLEKKSNVVSKQYTDSPRRNHNDNQKTSKPQQYNGAKVLPEIIGKPDASVMSLVLDDLAFGHYTVTNSVDEIIASKQIKTAAVANSPLYVGDATSKVKAFSIPEHMLASVMTGFITHDNVYTPRARDYLATDKWEKRFDVGPVGMTGLKFSPYQTSHWSLEGNIIPEEWSLLQDIPLNYHFLRRKDSFFAHPKVNARLEALIGDRINEFKHLGFTRQSYHVANSWAVHHSLMLNELPYYNVKRGTETLGQALFRNLVHETKLTPSWGLIEDDENRLTPHLDLNRVGVKYKHDIVVDAIHIATLANENSLENQIPFTKVRHPNGGVYMHRNISAKYGQGDIRFSNKDFLSKVVAGSGFRTRRVKTAPGKYNYQHPFRTDVNAAIQDSWIFANLYMKQSSMEALVDFINTPNKTYGRYDALYKEKVATVKEDAFGSDKNFFSDMINTFVKVQNDQPVNASKKALMEKVLDTRGSVFVSHPVGDRPTFYVVDGVQYYKSLTYIDPMSMLPMGIRPYAYADENKKDTDTNLIVYMLDRDLMTHYPNDYTYALDYLHEKTYQRLPQVIKFNDEPEAGFVKLENLPNTTLRDSKVVYDNSNKFDKARLLHSNKGLTTDVGITPVRIGAVKTITKDEEHEALNGKFHTPYIKPHILESIAVNLTSRRDYWVNAFIKPNGSIYPNPRFNTAYAFNDYVIEHPNDGDVGVMELNLSVMQTRLSAMSKPVNDAATEFNTDGLTNSLKVILNRYIAETTGWDSTYFDYEIASSEEKASLIEKHKDNEQLAKLIAKHNDKTAMQKRIDAFKVAVGESKMETYGKPFNFIFGVTRSKSGSQGGAYEFFDVDSLIEPSVSGTNPTTMRKMRSVLVKMTTKQNPYLYGTAYLLLNISAADTGDNLIKQTSMFGTTFDKAPTSPNNNIELSRHNSLKGIASIHDIHGLINVSDITLNKENRHKYVPAIADKRTSPDVSLYIRNKAFKGRVPNYRIETVLNSDVTTSKFGGTDNTNYDIYSYSGDRGHSYYVVNFKTLEKASEYGYRTGTASGHGNDVEGKTYYVDGHGDGQTVYGEMVAKYDYYTNTLTTYPTLELTRSYSVRPSMHEVPLDALMTPDGFIARRYPVTVRYGNAGLTVDLFFQSELSKVPVDRDSTNSMTTTDIDVKIEDKDKSMRMVVYGDRHYYDDKTLPVSTFSEFAGLGLINLCGYTNTLMLHEVEDRRLLRDLGRYNIKVRDVDETLILNDVTIQFLESKFHRFLKAIGYFEVSKRFDTRYLFGPIMVDRFEHTDDVAGSYFFDNYVQYGQEHYEFANTYSMFDVPEYARLFRQVFPDLQTPEDYAKHFDCGDVQFMYRLFKNNNVDADGDVGSSFIYPELAPIALSYTRQTMPSFTFFVSHNMSKRQAEKIIKEGKDVLLKKPIEFADLWKTYTPNRDDKEAPFVVPGFQGMVTPQPNNNASFKDYPWTDENETFNEVKVALDAFGHERIVMVTPERYNEEDDLLAVTNRDDQKRIMLVAANSRTNFLNSVIRYSDLNQEFVNDKVIDETHLARIVQKGNKYQTAFKLAASENHPIYSGVSNVVYKSVNLIPGGDGDSGGSSTEIVIRQGYSDQIWLNTNMIDWRLFLAQGRYDQDRASVPYRYSLAAIINPRLWKAGDNRHKGDKDWVKTNLGWMHKYRHVSDHMLPWLFPGMFVAEKANYLALNHFIDDINKHFNKEWHKDEDLWGKDFLRFFNPGYQTGGTPFITLNHKQLSQLVGFTNTTAAASKFNYLGKGIKWHLNDLIGKYDGWSLYQELRNRERDIVVGQLRPIDNPFPNKYRELFQDDAGQVFQRYTDGTLRLVAAGHVSQLAIETGDIRRIPHTANLGRWNVKPRGRDDYRERHVYGATEHTYQDKPDKNMPEDDKNALLAFIREKYDVDPVRARAMISMFNGLHEGTMTNVAGTQLPYDYRFSTNNFNRGDVLYYLEHRSVNRDGLYGYDVSLPNDELSWDIMRRHQDPRQETGALHMTPGLFGLHNYETLRDYRFTRDTISDIRDYMDHKAVRVKRTKTTYRLSGKFIEALLSGKMINPAYEIVDESKNEEIFAMTIPGSMEEGTKTKTKNYMDKVTSSDTSVPILSRGRQGVNVTRTHTRKELLEDIAVLRGAKLERYKGPNLHLWKKYPEPNVKRTAEEEAKAQLIMRRTRLVSGYRHQLNPVADKAEYEEYLEPSIIIRGQPPMMTPLFMRMQVLTKRDRRRYLRYLDTRTRDSMRMIGPMDYKSVAVETFPTRGFYSEINRVYLGLHHGTRQVHERIGWAGASDEAKEYILKLEETHYTKLNTYFPLYGLSKRLGLSLNANLGTVYRP